MISRLGLRVCAILGAVISAGSLPSDMASAPIPSGTAALQDFQATIQALLDRVSQSTDAYPSLTQGSAGSTHDAGTGSSQAGTGRPWEIEPTSAMGTSFELMGTSSGGSGYDAQPKLDQSHYETGEPTAWTSHADATPATGTSSTSAGGGYEAQPKPDYWHYETGGSTAGGSHAGATSATGIKGTSSGGSGYWAQPKPDDWHYETSGPTAWALDTDTPRTRELLEQSMADLSYLLPLSTKRNVPAQYAVNLQQQNALIASLSTESRLTPQALTTLKAVTADLHTKALYARKEEATAFQPIAVKVHTFRESKETSGYEVWYVGAGFRNDPKRWRRFPRFSSPTSTPLVPGTYCLWAQRHAGPTGSEVYFDVGPAGELDLEGP